MPSEILIKSYRRRLKLWLKYESEIFGVLSKTVSNTSRKSSGIGSRGSIDNYRDKLIVTLLYATGMRVGEFTKLKVEDIDFEERFIRIPAENSKTGEGRTIFIPKRKS